MKAFHLPFPTPPELLLWRGKYPLSHSHIPFFPQMKCFLLSNVKLMLPCSPSLVPSHRPAFACCKQPKNEQWKGLGTRLEFTYVETYCVSHTQLVCGECVFLALNEVAELIFQCKVNSSRLLLLCGEKSWVQLSIVLWFQYFETIVTSQT